VLRIRTTFVRIRILAYIKCVQTFTENKFLAQNLLLNLIYEKQVTIHVFLSIHNAFKHKIRLKNMSILVASEPDPEPNLDPVPNVRIRIRIRNTATLTAYRRTRMYL
jgi:hypothetical protein